MTEEKRQHLDDTAKKHRDNILDPIRNMLGLMKGLSQYEVLRDVLTNVTHPDPSMAADIEEAKSRIKTTNAELEKEHTALVHAMTMLIYEHQVMRDYLKERGVALTWGTPGGDYVN